MEVIFFSGASLLGLLFILAGITHFLRPDFYMRLMPMWIGGHRLWVIITGVLELIIGFGLLLQDYVQLAAWAALVLLSGFMIVHINMLIDREAGMGLPRWALWLRLLFQLGLIALAWRYT